MLRWGGVLGGWRGTADVATEYLWLMELGSKAWEARESHHSPSQLATAGWTYTNKPPLAAMAKKGHKSCFAENGAVLPLSSQPSMFWCEQPGTQYYVETTSTEQIRHGHGAPASQVSIMF